MSPAAKTPSSETDCRVSRTRTKPRPSSASPVSASQGAGPPGVIRTAASQGRFRSGSPTTSASVTAVTFLPPTKAMLWRSSAASMRRRTAAVWVCSGVSAASTKEKVSRLVSCPASVSRLASR